MMLVAASLLFLNRRPLHRTIGTVNAAVTRFRSKYCIAVLALIVELARVSRHCFLFGKSTIRADQDRYKSYCRHAGYLHKEDRKLVSISPLTEATTRWMGCIGYFFVCGGSPFADSACGDVRDCWLHLNILHGKICVTIGRQ